jgi:hypothetical protein
MCGCETWSLTLREEHRLRMFENRVMRRTDLEEIGWCNVDWIGLAEGMNTESSC